MSLSSKTNLFDAAAEEESGWTAYLEDFSVETKRNNKSDEYGEEEEESFSLVSDAASHAAWKKKNIKKSHDQVLKRLNFKKKPNRSSNNSKLSDPDLEDTASSPVNSPKVSSLRQMENNYGRLEINSENYMGKEAGFEEYQEMDDQADENTNNNDSLKKRGLCIMPLSLFMKYI